MPMFRVKFNCPTTISGECDIEAESLDDAYATAEDKIVSLMEAHTTAEQVYRRLDFKERTLRKPPVDPITLDGGAAQDNVDFEAIDVDEIEEL